MVLASTNKVKRLLCLSLIGQVSATELARSRDELMMLLADLPAGFSLLTDLSRLQSMEIGCEKEISWLMEVLDQKGIITIVRVIPEPQQDIGFNILAAFHYKRRVRSITCRSMEEASRHLSL